MLEQMLAVLSGALVGLALGLTGGGESIFASPRMMDVAVPANLACGKRSRS